MVSWPKKGPDQDKMTIFRPPDDNLPDVEVEIGDLYVNPYFQLLMTEQV